MHRFAHAAGYDASILDRLPQRHARAFAWFGACSLLGAAVVGVGAGCGVGVAFGSSGIGAAVGAAGGLAFLNVLRLFHAGTGFPAQAPRADLLRWHPSVVSVLVLLVLGALLAQPFLLLWMSAHVGLIARGHALWSHRPLAAAATAVVALLIAAPAWLRFVRLDAVRAYEDARWQRERRHIDAAFQAAQHAIHALLTPMSTFRAPLRVHHADPPYNTRPLRMGYDPAAFSNDSLILVKAKKQPQVEHLAPLPAPAVEPASLPTPPAAPPDRCPSPAARGTPIEDTVEDAPSLWQPRATDDDLGPPALDYFAVGRIPVSRAKRNLDAIAPFIAQMTGRDEGEARALVLAAPDDEPLHRLFSDWKKLPTLLHKNASFALDHGMAPMLAIVVQLPIEEVERRLREAPRDARLTRLFVHELAARLLPRR